MFSSCICSSFLMSYPSLVEETLLGGQCGCDGWALVQLCLVVIWFDEPAALSDACILKIKVTTGCSCNADFVCGRKIGL